MAAASKGRFTRFANAASRFTGSPAAFMLAIGVVLAWIVSGPIFAFSDTWQLVINTGTTIITFLMVFLIQNSQNRDSKALQIKLDELIRATKGARNTLLDLEELDEEDLQALKTRYERLAERARECTPQDDAATGTPEVEGSEEGSGTAGSTGKSAKHHHHHHGDGGRGTSTTPDQSS